MQEAQEQKFLLSTYYIPGTMDKNMSKTVARALEKPIKW